MRPRLDPVVNKGLAKSLSPDRTRTARRPRKGVPSEYEYPVSLKAKEDVTQAQQPTGQKQGTQQQRSEAQKQPDQSANRTARGENETAEAIAERKWLQSLVRIFAKPKDAKS
jgi:hypothetical protein